MTQDYFLNMHIHIYKYTGERYIQILIVGKIDGEGLEGIFYSLCFCVV